MIVPDHQLSLAIGKEGQNARLAARLTGVRIDIRGETQMDEGPDDDVDYAEGEWVQNAAGEMEFHAADGSVVTADQWNEGTPEEAAPAADAVAATEAAADEATATEATTNESGAVTAAAETDAASEEGGDDEQS